VKKEVRKKMDKNISGAPLLPREGGCPEDKAPAPKPPEKCGDLDDYIFRFNLEKPVSER
jgi:hypothetical protein